MKRCIAIILFLLSASFGVLQIVYADGECDSLKKLKDSYNKAIADEKAGKLIDAFKEYGTASSKWGCEGENLAAGDAEKGWKRVGQRLGAEAEKKGNLYNKVDIYGKDAAAAGAFEWFERIHSYSDADRVMMKLVRSKSEDINTFKTGLQHFYYRKKNEGQLKKGYNYSVNQDYFKELEDIASKNIDNALSKEEKAYNRKEIKAGEASPTTESLNQLGLARKWHSFEAGIYDEKIFSPDFRDTKGKIIAARAEKRGDALYPDDKEPLSLGEAMEYYKFAGDFKKVEKVKEKANRLGDASFKNNDLMRAKAYYEIAGNKARAKEIEALQKEKGKKQVDEMLRDDERKKKFKKEQKDLEKELGM